MTNSLADLDRHVVTYHYERWGRDVPFRPISASQLIALNHDYADLHGESIQAEGVLGFYAELLATSCCDPKCTADEWIEQATQTTIVELGQEALRVNGLLVEDAKKN